MLLGGDVTETKDAIDEVQRDHSCGAARLGASGRNKVGDWY